MGWMLVAIGGGAALGAWLRWGLSLWLSTGFQGGSGSLPWGTLAANLIGGLAIGATLALFTQHPGVSPVWRAFLTTGLLGGLTTFSTFSLETVTLMQHGRWAAALGWAGLHLAGSLLATAAGFAAAQGLSRG